MEDVIGEVTLTLTIEAEWENQKRNFLLRLISDNKNGYRDSSGQFKPRVQLALAFMHHMSKNREFDRFMLSTLNVCLHGDEGEKKRGNGLLHEAAKNGQCGDLEKFLSPTNLSACNNIGETALHLAAEFEHSQDVEILLRAGATIQVS